MAKKKYASGVTEGKVWVSVGLKFSANFSSRDFNVGLETPILKGEDDGNALERTHRRVVGFFDENCDDTLDFLGNLIEEAKNGES